MPKVLNRNTCTEVEYVNAVYVGRPSKWGNPFVMGKDGTRNEVVKKYKDHLDYVLEGSPDVKDKLIKELKGKDLVCWCSPETCHADILLEYANANS